MQERKRRCPLLLEAEERTKTLKQLRAGQEEELDVPEVRQAMHAHAQRAVEVEEWLAMEQARLRTRDWLGGGQALAVDESMAVPSDDWRVPEQGGPVGQHAPP